MHCKLYLNKQINTMLGLLYLANAERNYEEKRHFQQETFNCKKTKQKQAKNNTSKSSERIPTGQVFSIDASLSLIHKTS